MEPNATFFREQNVGQRHMMAKSVKCFNLVETKNNAYTGVNSSPDVGERQEIFGGSERWPNGPSGSTNNRLRCMRSKAGGEKQG